MSSAGGGGGAAGQQAKKRRHPQADVQPRPQTGGGAGPSSSYGGGSSSSYQARNSNSQSFSESGGPRQLHVVEFAEARAREIASLTHILSASVGGSAAAPSGGGTSGAAQISGGGRRVFQSLPRHMRRRAMSHNIARLPKRLQGAAKREMDKIEKSSPATKTPVGEDGEAQPAKKGPSRRTRRRPRNILAMHAHRMAQHQWLETHLWHAKRMYMESAWGYKIATRPTDRSLRACYNANVHLATIFDASYTQVLAIQGPSVEAIASWMQPFVHPSQWSRLCSPEVASGHRETELQLHQPGAAPYGFVAQVKCQWTGDASTAAPSTVKQLWLWLHPSVYAFVQSMLEAALPSPSSPASTSSSSSSTPLSVIPLLGQLCRLELRGHRCQAVLRMAIRAVEKQQKSSTATTKDGEDVEMTDASASSSSSSPPTVSSLLSRYLSPCLFPCSLILPLQAEHPAHMRPQPFQPFGFAAEPGGEGKRERMKGRIEEKRQTLPFEFDDSKPPEEKRNNTFSKETDASMKGTLSAADHAFLFRSITSSTPSLSSPLFHTSFRLRHTRETPFGEKKAKYKRIAVREQERRRRMHERRAGMSKEEMQAREEEEATMSDTTGMKSTSRQPSSSSTAVAGGNRSANQRQGSRTLPTKVHVQQSKDDLDIGSSTTPLHSPAQPLPAPLTNQPYLLLIQQSGSHAQSTAATPKAHVNSAQHSLGSGWDIVCAAGWATILWKAFVYAGARAIGHCDRSAFLHEQFRLDHLEPIDHPDSHAGQIAALFRARTLSWHSARVPTNKRPSFPRNHICHPFKQAWWELMEMQEQQEGERRYEESVRKEQTNASVRSAESESESESDKEVAPPKTKKQKIAAAAPQKKEQESKEDVEIKDAISSDKKSVPTPSSKRLSKKQQKLLLRPAKLPPFELHPVPEEMREEHVPFWAWRNWKEEYETAKDKQGGLTLASFLTSPSAQLGSASCLLPVGIRCPSGGLPEDSALLCRPNSEESATFEKHGSALAEKSHKGGSYGREEESSAWSVLNEQNNHLGVPAHPMRTTIGYAVHGWFSYQQGCGVAIGFVPLQQFTDLLSRHPASASPSVWVWIRNQNSLTYRAAQMQLI